MNTKRVFNFLIILITAGILIPVSSCTHKADITTFPEVCFDRDVLPVFQNNCTMAGCHGAGEHEGFALTSYSEIMKHVKAGDAAGSEIYQVIAQPWGILRMPPDQPLSRDNRTLIRIWIEQGAAETICGDNGNGDPGNTNTGVARACFSRDILPVLLSKCGTAGCHDAITHKEGYIFTSYANTMKAVTAGNASGSKLYKVITTSTGESKMPPSGRTQLTVAEIDSIRKWIGYGALNETCAQPCDTVNPITFSGTIWPIMQSSCTGCHSGSSPSGGISLTSYANVSSIASNGMLMKALKGSGVAVMPPSGSFSACRIRQFDIWVKNGYANN